MEWESVGVLAGLVAAVAALIGVAPQVRPRMARRAQLKASLEILSLLPDDSEARADLLGHVDRRVRDLIRREDHETRNWFNALSGTYVAAVCMLFGIAQYPTVWLVPLYVLLSVLGGAAAYDGFRRGLRGDHGFRLGESHAERTTSDDSSVGR